MTEISYKGANHIKVQTKQTVIVVDPASSGVKDAKLTDKADVQLLTQSAFASKPHEKQLSISMPGEYEIADVSISGFDAIAQVDPKAKSVFYRLTTHDCIIGILGNINPDAITGDQLEKLGVVDILVVPIGGNGYTVDSHGAVKLTQRINPKIVIPVHYKEDGVVYEVDQQPIEYFLKELGQNAQLEASLKIKQAGQLPDTLTVFQLEKTSN